MSNNFLSSILSGLGLRPKRDKGLEDDPRGTVYDDSVRPLDPKGNPKGTTYDDTVRPLDPKGNPKGTVFDDSVRPLDPKG